MTPPNPKPATRLMLFSAYPLTKEVMGRVTGAAAYGAVESVCLGELKRSSPVAIARALAKMGGPELSLWIVVSDHNYQPYLNLMLLLASLVRARSYDVVDYAGLRQPTSRVAIWLFSPWRLIWGSIQGAWAVYRADRASRSLAQLPRSQHKVLSARPSVAYLKTNLWFGVQAGGSIGHVAGVVNGFSRLGCPIHVFTAEDLPLIDRDVAITTVPIKASGGIPLEVNGYMFQGVFDRYLARQQVALAGVELVYQRNCLVNYSGLALARRLGVPLVIEYNGSEVWISKHWGTPLRFSAVAQRIEDINLRHAQLIVVVSDVLRDELLERGIEPGRILSYPNCVDPQVFRRDRFPPADGLALRARLDIAPDAVVCTFVGTFGPWHGVDVMARAIVQLTHDRLQWLRDNKVHFVFVGDGQLMPRVRALLADVPVDLFTFTGLVPQTEAPRYLAISDVLLSPHVPNPDGSRFFGSPTKLFEYMAMGKSIVASELEQIGEVLKGSWHIGRQGVPDGADRLADCAALLTDPGNVDQLCDALLYLVAQHESRQVLGDAARQLALTKYTWEQQVSEILSMLKPSVGA